MEKRLWAASESFDAEKRARLDSIPGNAPDSEELLEAEFYIEQRLVGWIIGRGGGTLKEIEQGHQVKILVDQSTKELGYSNVKISGNASAVQQAAEHINSSLARASGGANEGTLVGPFLLDSPPMKSEDLFEELQIEQRFVGWLLGRGGGVVREIEESSKCKISINQETRSLGYSVVQLHGNNSQREQARNLIQESIERAKETSGGMSKGAPTAAAAFGGGHCGGGGIAPTFVAAGCGGCGGSPSLVHGGHEEALQVEQKWVGWLLGKGGGLAHEIEAESGARIEIDQSTKSFGFSTVRIVGDTTQVELAKQRVNASLQKVGGAPLGSGNGGGCGSTSTQVQVEQQWVGWVLGKGGSVLKEIELATGAKVTINQDTKAMGYSIATLSGTPFQVTAAYEQMAEKLRRVDAAGSGLQILGPASAAGTGIGGPKAQAAPFAQQQSTPAAQAALGAIDGHVEGSLTVEQKFVGWLLGKSGMVLKEMEMQSGAKIKIDQSTKDFGFSTVRVSGDWQQTAVARQLIQEKLAQA